MGLLADLLPMGVRASGDPTDERYWTPTAPPTWTGFAVTPELALKVSAVYTAIQIIAGTIGRLPLILYRELDTGGKERAKDHPLYPILHDQPNDLQTSQEWREMGTAHLLLRGNFVNEIISGPRGFVEEIWPLHPDRVMIERISGTRRLRYAYTDEDGGQRTIPTERIVHVRGLSLNGVTGVSVLTYARESMGLWLAMERYGAKFFTNAARPSGALKHPAKLDPEVRDRMKAEITAAHAGENVHRMMLLEGGLDWVQLGMTAEDAQLLQSKEFQVREIARWFNLPGHMLVVSKEPTHASVEQDARFLVDFTLAPWESRWASAIKRDLIVDEPDLFAEMLFDALLRGNTLDRFNAYHVATGGKAWMWPSEVRVKENMAPNPELDAMPAQGAAPARPSDPARREPAPEDTEEERPRRRRQGAAGRARLIVAEVAERVVRREIKGIQERAVKFASAPAEWRATLEDFYAEHAGYVAAALQLAPRPARAYADAHRGALLDGDGGLAGVRAVLTQWEAEAPAELVALALAGEGELVEP